MACVALAAKLRMVMLEKAQLKKQNWMKEAFLKTLSHELRTPLHSVCGLAEIIAKDDLYLSKSEKRAIANQILYNVELISTQLDEVLLFAGNGNGHKLQEETLSPNQLCLKCVEANRIKEQLNPNIKLTFRRELSDETFIRTDRHLLEYIINQIIKETGYTDVVTVATGGLGKIIFDETDTIQIYDPDLTLHVGYWFVVLWGLCAGMFVGCVSAALAEVLSIFPVLFRRLNVKSGMSFYMIMMALGKMSGAFWYFFHGLEP